MHTYLYEAQMYADSVGLHRCKHTLYIYDLLIIALFKAWVADGEHKLTHWTRGMTIISLKVIKETFTLVVSLGAAFLVRHSAL